MSKFRYIDRDKKESIVLIPGWATDFRIFDGLDIEYNYLVPVEYSPRGFGDDLERALNEHALNRISLLGWSMGGFVACEILPRFRHRIDTLTLVSVRRRYDKANNDMIKAVLVKNKKGFLRKFYADCFTGCDRDLYELLKAGLLKEYRDNLELAYLLDGLNYLSTHSIEPQTLVGASVTFVHGSADTIAPMGEAVEMHDALPGARLVSIEGAGHMPFFSVDFKRIFDGAHAQ